MGELRIHLEGFELIQRGLEVNSKLELILWRGLDNYNSAHPTLERLTRLGPAELETTHATMSQVS